MENQNLKTEILLELIFCVEIDQEEEQFIQNILPTYLRKLNCFMSAVFKEDEGKLVEKYVLPFTFKKDKTWEKLADIIDKQNINTAVYDISIGNKYYYIYKLEKYGSIIFGRYNEFDKILKNELVFVCNFLGKVLHHNHLEKLKRISDEKYANERKLLRTIIDNIPKNIYNKD